MDLLTTSEDSAVLVDAEDHRRFSSTMTNGLDFRDDVCPREQELTAFEEVSLKVCAQPESHDGDLINVRDLTEFSNLPFGQELSFVHHDTGNRVLLLRPANDFDQGIGAVEVQGFSMQTNSRGDPAEAITGIELGREKQRQHSLFSIIPCRLEQCGGLAGVHG